MEYRKAIEVLLRKTRDTPIPTSTAQGGLLENVSHFAQALRSAGHTKEAEALDQALQKCHQSVEYGGLEYASKTTLSKFEEAEVLFQIEAHLLAISAREQGWQTPVPLPSRHVETKPMTLAQKIFAHHAIEGAPKEGLHLGDVARVAIDWVLASELSYLIGIKKTLDEVGQPGIFRNDRFWLAGDHVYDPRIASSPRVQTLYHAAEKAKRDFRMTEYQGMNYTIMHTEFVRQRAQPGMLVVGADSHTCSAGAVGCLAIGLGAIDVAMALTTGETWFKIPESIRINFTGKPAFGTSGKDVILHILQVLRRNTVAAERIVEFTGPGLQWLSVDARFAICNMCTEFGAVTGLFIPDEITQDYVSRRPVKANKSDSVFFRPDEGAQYAGIFEIDLSKVEPTIALYPNPDDVVPLSERPDMKFDGVFIGACTTTEEDLILAGLILKAGLAKGLNIVSGKRHIVPGSLPIVARLRKMGLLEVYEVAGFTRGPPGCSYCVGMAADQAGKGETWLSSQNRNFKNRMGTGSIGNITSAAVVAASSFGMRLTHPAALITDIDTEAFRDYWHDVHSDSPKEVQYVEPSLERRTSQWKSISHGSAGAADSIQPETGVASTLASRVITLEDFIDTDALAPAMAITMSKSDAGLGEHCLEHTYPEFRQKVRDGQRMVVAGKAFGVGSSREEAVRALMGLGIKAVIARSFAFIYSRNQASLGLLGIEVHEDAFYAAATENTPVAIDLPSRKIRVGEDVNALEFGFSMAEMEERLLEFGGICTAYKRFRNELWKHMVVARDGAQEESLTTRVNEVVQQRGNGVNIKLQW